MFVTIPHTRYRYCMTSRNIDFTMRRPLLYSFYLVVYDSLVALSSAFSTFLVTSYIRSIRFNIDSSYQYYLILSFSELYFLSPLSFSLTNLISTFNPHFFLLSCFLLFSLFLFLFFHISFFLLFSFLLSFSFFLSYFLCLSYILSFSFFLSFILSSSFFRSIFMKANSPGPQYELLW